MYIYLYVALSDAGRRAVSHCPTMLPMRQNMIALDSSWSPFPKPFIFIDIVAGQCLETLRERLTQRPQMVGRFKENLCVITPRFATVDR